MALKKSYEETRSINGNWNLVGIGYNSTDETYKPNLLIPILKQFGYTKLQINVSFDYRADSEFLLHNGKLRLQIANYNKSEELGRAEFAYKPDWAGRAYFSKVFDIDKTKKDTGEFMLLWSRVENDAFLISYNKYRVGNRIITVTALK